MGGSNETYLPGDGNLRIHESGGDVHIHHDADGLKFVMPTAEFKAAYKTLKRDLTVPKGNVFEAKLHDAHGVRLVAVRDGDEVEWSLESDAAPVDGFDEMDEFLSHH